MATVIRCDTRCAYRKYGKCTRVMVEISMTGSCKHNEYDRGQGIRKKKIK